MLEPMGTTSTDGNKMMMTDEVITSTSIRKKLNDAPWMLLGKKLIWDFMSYLLSME